eukprot:PLAT6619.1.p1 GENE.PLAT6619.1~~PLAT6619.1.p1  ORF type:complete len:1209 (+),score=570.20 PLAT6619.1:146-3772(+)
MEDEEQAVAEKYPFSIRCRLWKTTSRAGMMWDIFQVFLSMLACILYVVETYRKTQAWDWMEILEVVMTVFFLADYVFALYIAERRLRFIISLQGLVDLFTIVPVFLKLSPQSTFATRTLGFLRFIRILRIMRILRAFRVLDHALSPVRRQTFNLVLTLTSLVFLAAGLVQILESDFYRACNYVDAKDMPSCVPPRDHKDWTPDYTLEGECDCAEKECQVWPDRFGSLNDVRCFKWDFFRSFYFIIVTISTVGYGDFNPSNPLSRMLVIMFITIALVMVPMQVNRLTELLGMQSKFRKSFVPEFGQTHVLVVGNITASSLKRFFDEFYHADRFESGREALERIAVVLSPEEPSEEIRSLILQPRLSSRVQYVVGSVLVTKDLLRVSADKCLACFILANKQAKDVMSEDSSTVLRALSLENFNSNLMTYVQILSPTSNEALMEADVDYVVCVNSMKNAIVARSCIVKGLSTLLDNLFHTFSDENDGDEPWRKEYNDGAGLELYPIVTDSHNDSLLAVHHYSFQLLAYGITAYFKLSRLTLLGIERQVTLPSGEVKPQVFLSPCYMKLQSGDTLLVMAEYRAQIKPLEEPTEAMLRDMKRVLNIDHKVRISEIRKAMTQIDASGQLKALAGAHMSPSRRGRSWHGSARGSSRDWADFDDDSGDDDEHDSAALARSGRVASLGDVELVVRDSHDDSHSAADAAAAPAAAVPSAFPIDDGDSEEEDEDDDDFDAAAAAETSAAAVVAAAGGKRSDDDDASAPGWRGEVDDAAVVARTLEADEAAMKRMESARRLLRRSSTRGRGMSAGRHAPRSHRLAGVAHGVSVAQALASDAWYHDQVEAPPPADLEGHILVFGSLDELLLLLLPLRSPYLKGTSMYRPIVLMAELPLADWDDWPEVRELGDIYYLRGHPARRADLARARVETAYSYLIRSNRQSVRAVDGQLVDSNAIMLYLAMSKRVPDDVFSIVELTYASNMGILNSKMIRAIGRHRSEALSFKARLRVGAGNADFLAVNAADLAISEDSDRTPARADSAGDHHSMPYFAGGRGYVADLFDSLLCQTFYSASTLKICTLMLSDEDSDITGSTGSSGSASDGSADDGSDGDGEEKAETPHIYQVPVPVEFWGADYFELFTHFVLYHAMLPLGLFRAQTWANRALLPYVYTGPPQDAIVNKNDLVFVLSTAVQADRFIRRGARERASLPAATVRRLEREL